MNPSCFLRSVRERWESPAVTSDSATMDRLAKLDHQPTRLAVTAERGLLAVLEGSCKVPIAGHARLPMVRSFSKALWLTFREPCRDSGTDERSSR